MQSTAKRNRGRIEAAHHIDAHIKFAQLAPLHLAASASRRPARAATSRRPPRAAHPAPPPRSTTSLHPLRSTHFAPLTSLHPLRSTHFVPSISRHPPRFAYLARSIRNFYASHNGRCRDQRSPVQCTQELPCMVADSIGAMSANDLRSCSATWNRHEPQDHVQPWLSSTALNVYRSRVPASLSRAQFCDSSLKYIDIYNLKWHCSSSLLGGSRSPE